MLDKKLTALLRIIVTMCGEIFHVIDKSEIIKALGNKIYAESHSLMLMLRLLAGKELITIKYEDEAEVCLCATRKGVDYIQDIKTISNSNSKAKVEYKVYIMVFFCALLGALAGSIINQLFKLVF